MAPLSTKRQSLKSWAIRTQVFLDTAYKGILEYPTWHHHVALHALLRGLGYLLLYLGSVRQFVLCVTIHEEPAILERTLGVSKAETAETLCMSLAQTPMHIMQRLSQKHRLPEYLILLRTLLSDHS